MMEVRFTCAPSSPDNATADVEFTFKTIVMEQGNVAGTLTVDDASVRLVPPILGPQVTSTFIVKGPAIPKGQQAHTTGDHPYWATPFGLNHREEHDPADHWGTTLLLSNWTHGTGEVMYSKSYSIEGVGQSEETTLELVHTPK